MTEKILTLFQGGRKASNYGGDFYRLSENEIWRLDLKWPGGYRAALPYSRLHEVVYLPSLDGGIEELQLHYPGYSAVRIMGRQLSPLYDAFLTQRVGWLRQRAEDENVGGANLCVERIDYYPLADWEVDFAAREERHEEWNRLREKTEKEPE